LLFSAVIGATAAGIGGCVTVPPPPPPPPPSQPEAPPFYDDLSPYGDWWWHERWGWVYSPTVGAGWRPYTHGHWVWTDAYGWTWVSSEPFGWACHHYGRWAWLDDAGWVWIPGRVWAPAWVVWRTGPGIIGWAPLGPEAVWVPGRGFVVVDVVGGIGPWAWVFVDEPDFVVINVITVVHTQARNPAILPHARVVHRPERGDGGRVVQRGIERTHVERVVGRAVPSARLVHDQREAAADAVVVRRERAEEQRAERDGRDLDIEPPRRPAPRAAEVRPLGPVDAPDDDVDRRFDDEKRRVVERQERERRTPPPIAPRDDDLKRLHQQENDELERSKQKEKTAREQKKKVPRKIYPPKKKAPPPEKKKG
jgi:hypothetical protein